jgi:mannose-6-phosphate isomerase-like protein (cupin superfamily)
VSQLLRGVLSAALVLVTPCALADKPAQKPAEVFSANDAGLKWRPCPAFIPKGCEVTLLHGYPWKDNADIFFRVPANFTIPSHWHTSPERIVLVSGQLEITYDGRRPAVLKPGMYAYSPAKLPHTAVCANGDPCILFISYDGPIDVIATKRPAD